MRTIAVIPARYSSKRLPGKPLLDLAGKPMIQRVHEQVVKARRVDDVVVATDDERIRECVSAFGGRVLMTSNDHASGTDRVAEVVTLLGLESDTDLVVNVQGDEPLVSPEAIDEAIDVARTAAGAMATLKREITDKERLLDPNVVKVTTDATGFALYFSRSPIPSGPSGPSGPWAADSTDLPRGVYYEHVGLYVYPAVVLTKLAATPPVALERVERLEQLRALVHGIRIRVAETRHASIAVDTESDLERVREYLSAGHGSTIESMKSKSVNEAMVRSNS